MAAYEDLKDYSRPDLVNLLAGLGESPYRSDQIFAWLYKDGVMKLGAMKNLPSSLIKTLAERFYISKPKLLDEKVSRTDGTAKYLLGLEDSNTIETVYIPEKKRATVCVSSQVGCRRACSFCASSKGGFVRDLRTGEILNEILFIKIDKKMPITNVVFMGIGEPFDNYDNVMKAIRILNDPGGFNIGARKMTVSTCGLVPGIEKFSEENLQVELSISLHAADNDLRSKLVSANRKYPLEALMRECKKYIDKTKRVITFEYVLMKEVNSSGEDALKLAGLLKGIKCKVNLIRYNNIKALGYEAPSEEDANKFLEILAKKGLNATLRKSRGEDIDAGCGQLRISRM